jgi:hypothetical protein
MPRRQLTRGTWAESHGQHYILNIPGLFRVWRPESDHSSRRDPARDSYTRRRPPLHGPSRSDIDGLCDHQDFSSDHRGGLTYQADSRLDGPSPLDSWERLHDALPSNKGDYRYRPGPAGQLHGSIRSLNEVRQPAWVREEGEPRGYYPGTLSKFANMHSRREARRHFEANDDCQHQSHFAAAPTSQTLRVPIQPHRAPARRLGGSRIQPRPLHLGSVAVQRLPRQAV